MADLLASTATAAALTPVGAPSAKPSSSCINTRSVYNAAMTATATSSASPLEVYASTHRTRRIPVDIRERWSGRMVGLGLVARGAAGARDYLARFGRSMGATKAIHLASCAEEHGEDAIARVFWERAMSLDPVGAARAADAAGHTPAPAAAPAPRRVARAAAAPAATCPSLPSDLQPGAVVPWQPVDATQDRAAFIADPAWWGQPKRDGSKDIIICADGVLAHQSRRGKTRESGHAAIDAAIRATGIACVLEGELTFLDAAGGEHRTGAQASTANMNDGCPTAPVITRFCVFNCLAADGADLRGADAAVRLAAVARIVAATNAHLAATPDATDAQIEAVPTARTAAEKQTLVETQTAEGREGEVWFRHALPYGHGTAAPSDLCRTKYLSETTCVITGLTPSLAAGRLFGALEVATTTDHRAIGAVGSGFSAADMGRLVALHAMRPGRVTILVRHQGMTEAGALWHPRFVEIIDESAA